MGPLRYKTSLQTLFFVFIAELSFLLAIRRGGKRAGQSTLDVLPHACWNLIARHLTTDDAYHSLLPAYPHLFDKVKNNVWVSQLPAHRLMEHVRDVMLASPNNLKSLTLNFRPRNESHLKKLRLLLKSPSLVSLTVSNLVWLVGEKISTELTELDLEVQQTDYDVDIWAMWCPASPAPNKITTLSVEAVRGHATVHLDDEPAPAYLAGSSTCFQVFDRLEKVTFRPPPADQFWASSSDLALGRLRELTLDECRHNDAASDHLCSLRFVNHAGRFSNLVQLKLVSACDLLDPLLELGVVLPSLEVFVVEYSSVPGDSETWTRVATLFPNLKRLEITGRPIPDKAVFTEVLPKRFAKLRVIVLEDCDLSIRTCLIMAVELLKHRQTGAISIQCDLPQGYASAATAAFLDSLKMISSCKVYTEPAQLVDGFSGSFYFYLDRE